MTDVIEPARISESPKRGPGRPKKAVEVLVEETSKLMDECLEKAVASPVALEKSVPLDGNLQKAVVQVIRMIDGCDWPSYTNRIIGNSGLPRWDHHKHSLLCTLRQMTWEMCHDVEFVTPIIDYYINKIRVGSTEGLVRFMALHAIGAAFPAAVKQELSNVG